MCFEKCLRLGIKHAKAQCGHEKHTDLIRLTHSAFGLPSKYKLVCKNLKQSISPSHASDRIASERARSRLCVDDVRL